MKKDALILVRGGGDLATGTIHRLWSAGLRVLVLEAEHPAAIRRQVSLCEAVYEGETAVEGLRAVRIETLAQAEEVWKQNAVPVLVDPQGKSIAPAKPDVLVDAILAKKNLGTTRDMAPLTIALGPGFTAGQDVDVVVETKRGHRLGRIIREGSAIPDTGIPGIIGGYGKERVIHAGTAGIFMNLRKIGDIVEAGETIAQIRTADGAMISVTTQITGILRGLLRSSYLRAVRIETLAQAEEVWKQNAVPVLVDPQGKSIAPAKPDVLVDAILAKKNLGTTRDMAPLTIALGPGFTAGQDVDVVVETKRGHRLGRIIREGSAIPDTGIPGIIGGYGKERVIHAGTAGIFMNLRKIGDIVEAGETIAQIRTADGAMISVTTQITGILRGLLRSSYPVTPGFKVADIDPRKEELSNCFLISDKARCIAGSVLELVCAQLWK